MAKSIGSVAAILSLNSGQFTAGLADASSQLKNFGRSVSDAFGKSLPNMGLPVFGGQGLTAQQKELAAINDAAILAQKNVAGVGSALHFGSASHGIKALSGSLFLLTGQTGFFAVEAARAASHVSKWASESGGLTSALKAVGTGLAGLLSSLNPVILAVVAAAAAWEVYSSVMEDAKEKAEEQKAAHDASIKGMKELLAGSQKHAVLTGQITESEAKIGSLLDQGVPEDTARVTVQIELANKALEREKRLEEEVAAAQATRIENFVKLQKEADDQNKKIIEDRAARETEFEEKIAEARDRAMEDKKRAAQQALIGNGLAKGSQFESDPVKRTLMDFQERIDALRNSKDKIGADFGISSASFRDAPIGQVIGPQTEQSKTNQHLEDIKEIQRQLLNYVETNGLGVTIDG